MVTGMYVKAEKVFWQMIIPLLSKSRPIRKGIQQSASLIELIKNASPKLQFILVAVSGWTLGICFGVVTAIIF